jgi:hypothetical protein
MAADLSNPFISDTQSVNAEHISLQSETVEVAAAVRASGKTLVKYQLRSRARGSSTRVEILEGNFVKLNFKRARAETQEHTVDLRYVDPRPIGIRKVGWPWMYVAIAFTVLGLAAGIFAVYYASPFARVWAVPTAIVLGTFMVSSYLLCLYFTTESLLFVSQTGRARFITITGGLGTTRAARRCARDIVKHISAARKAFKQPRAQYLRDEMREHVRLRDAGIVSDQQYELAISKILKAHN